MKIKSTLGKDSTNHSLEYCNNIVMLYSQYIYENQICILGDNNKWLKTKRNNMNRWALEFKHWLKMNVTLKYTSISVIRREFY